MAIKLTTSWQLVAEGTSQVTTNCKGYVRLYMKYAPINSSSDTIYYEIRQLAYNQYGSYLGWEWTGSIAWSILSGSTARASGSFTQSAIYSTKDKDDLTQEVVRASGSYTASRNSDGTYSDTIKLKAPVYQTTVTTAENTITLPPYYTLTVNGNLDGSISSNTSSHGTFTISLNGGAHSSRITSYSNKVLEGTTWAIGGPYPNTGKTYNGYSAGDKSGTVTGNTTVTIKFNSTQYGITYTLNGGSNSTSNPSSAIYGQVINLVNPTRTGYTFTGWTSSNVTITNGSFTMPASNITVVANWTAATYTNTIRHWARGFQNGEGNNGGSNNLRHLRDTSFTQEYNTTIVYDQSKAITPPNGFVVSTAIGSSSFSSGWVTYNMPAKLTQPAKSTSMQYDYVPISYPITYELNGGKNSTSNPAYYNVLYGVTLQQPTKQGYDFIGWTADGQPITGINQGASAYFSNADDMYNKLATRTTGDITIVANWKLNAACLHKKVNGDWIKGIPYVKVNDKWKIATRIFTKVNNEWVETKK